MISIQVDDENGINWARRAAIIVAMSKACGLTLEETLQNAQDASDEVKQLIREMWEHTEREIE